MIHVTTTEYSGPESHEAVRHVVAESWWRVHGHIREFVSIVHMIIGSRVVEAFVVDPKAQPCAWT